MSTRRPTTSDRDIAAWILALPVGEHVIQVTEGRTTLGAAESKVEGSMMIWRGDGTRITMIRKDKSP